jgi:hypothetical protein
MYELKGYYSFENILNKKGSLRTKMIAVQKFVPIVQKTYD